MFGGDNWVNYYYTLDTFNWPSISCGDGQPGSGCPGTFITQFDFRPVANNPSHDLVDPNLKAARSQEFTLGMDHELNRTMSIGVRYAHKWVDYAVEAVCNFTPSGEEDCGVNNPGLGSELGTYPLGRSNPAQPEAVRDYDGVEVRLRKRLSNRWSADVSYLYSYLRGNWSGLASSDEAVGSLQPNSGRAFNLLTTPTTRRQPDIRPPRHRSPAPVQGAGHLRSSVGDHGGRQRDRREWRAAVDGHDRKEHDLLSLRPRRSRPRPTFSQMDLMLQQEFRLPGNMRVMFGVNASNLFDQKTKTAFQTTPYRDQFNVSRFGVLWRIRSGGTGDRAELSPGCSLWPGQRLQDSA